MRVVVQERRRFVRDAIGAVLSRMPDVEVVATVTAAELQEACRDRRPDVAVVDLDDPAVAIEELSVAAAEGDRRITIVALHARSHGSFEVRPEVTVRTVADTQGIDGVVQAVRVWVPHPQAPTTPLTEREAQILRLIAAGGRSADIGTRLGISPRTVEEHKRRVFTKLDVRNQSHAVARAIQLGLLGLGED